MNYIINWIQLDDLNCFTIFEIQIACKLIYALKVDCLARKNECKGTLFALHTNTL